MAGSTVNLDRFRVYKMSLDGSVPTHLTQGPRDVEARCTADGTWLFYLEAQDFGALVLMRQPLRGGPAQKVSANRELYDRSPDGKFIAIVPPETPSRLEILSMDSFQKIKSFTLPNDNALRFSLSVDGKSSFYTTKIGTDTTIWRQPLTATTPVRMATLAGRDVDWFDPSPDGKKLGLIIKTPTSEVVLLHECSDDSLLRLS